MLTKVSIVDKQRMHILWIRNEYTVLLIQILEGLRDKVSNSHWGNMDKEIILEFIPCSYYFSYK